MPSTVKPKCLVSELIESAMYLYQATKDPYFLEIGRDMLESIDESAKTPCGYATVSEYKDIRNYLDISTDEDPDKFEINQMFI